MVIASLVSVGSITTFIWALFMAGITCAGPEGPL